MAVRNAGFQKLKWLPDPYTSVWRFSTSKSVFFVRDRDQRSSTMFHSLASSSAAVLYVLLTLSSFTLLSHAFIPAIPTNITDGLANQQQGTLNVFWYPQGTFIDRTRRVAAVSKTDPGTALVKCALDFIVHPRLMFDIN